MGSGDWNDGMNKVGALGQGESVWMAWFLAVVLRRFAPLLEARGDSDRAKSYRAKADALVHSVEDTAWDGNWYLRAFFDDGSPLGSAQSDECRIDSLAQSWSVIAGADPQRVQRAMQAVDEQLVRAPESLVLLFTPPFDATLLDPGYIKGYLPGIRENGGQYTHAAAWVVQAVALQGRGARACEIFDMLNPVLLANTPEKADRYRVEPYVVAADVYSNSRHTGRGGWTWYTGSAAWMYRVVLESILGISVTGDLLRVCPSIPPNWPGFEVVLRRPNSTWRINVKNPNGVEAGVRSISCDGRVVQSDVVQLIDDGAEHVVEIEMGPLLHQAERVAGVSRGFESRPS
jgi:cyclic beta-1,2-glucan synthetase